jgi:hypothetical protein
MAPTPKQFRTVRPFMPGMPPGGQGLNTPTYRIEEQIRSILPPATQYGATILLCEAFTPAGTGADIGEVMVPFSPADGVTQLLWHVRRLWLRVNVAGGAPAVNIEVSSVVGAFTATAIGTLTMPSGAYEVYIAPTGGVVYSANKLRFNVTALGTATGWTIGVELGA